MSVLVKPVFVPTLAAARHCGLGLALFATLTSCASASQLGKSATIKLDDGMRKIEAQYEYACSIKGPGVTVTVH